MQVAGGRGATRTRRGSRRGDLGERGFCSAVARRHGLSPQQLFGWRRQLQAAQTALSHPEELQFVPAVLDAASSPPVRRQHRTPRRQAEPVAGIIEVEIDGVTVRVGRGADAKTVTAVLRALKAGA